jgi:hypothetical protein
MTSSRAAWLSLITGLGIWGWWHITGLTAQRFTWPRKLTFGLPILLASLIALGAFGIRTSSLIRVANTAPGEASAGSRLEITRNTIQLIRDYPFTGGGLASFSGLYSTYIRVIHVPEFFYSHNLYTDIALEQGLPGLIAFLVVLTCTGWILFTSQSADRLQNYLVGASLASLAVVILHGFLDDALYGMGGTPLLFLIPGLATSLRFTNAVGAQKPGGIAFTHRKRSSTARGWVLGSALTFLGLGVAGLLYAKPLTSTWYANIGAVAMSRVQLFVWPDSTPDTHITQIRIEFGADLFSRSLDQNPDNCTALYRSGIYAYMRKDFEQAKNYLESSYTRNRSHRGIRKLLGYTYIWTGDILKAKDLLITIPEAGEELGVYTWWWGTQNRADLADLASQMAAQLQQH